MLLSVGDLGLRETLAPTAGDGMGEVFHAKDTDVARPPAPLDGYVVGYLLPTPHHVRHYERVEVKRFHVHRC